MANLFDQKMLRQYEVFLKQIGPLNRLHNNDDTEITLKTAKKFCDTYLKGSSCIHSYAPGKAYNYWKIPKRWSLRKFRLIGPDGKVISKKTDSPFVVAPYSSPVNRYIELNDLKKHIFNNKGLPNSYLFNFRLMYRHWEKDWHISLPYNVIKKLKKGCYKVEIETSLSNAPMPVFEYFLKGKSNKTIFLVGHIDHSDMVNDSISGCLSSLQAVHALENIYKKTEYSYRVLWVPEIIGSAVYLKTNENLLKNTYYALCSNMTSHEAPIVLSLSKSQTSLLDLAINLALKESGLAHEIQPFHRYPDCGDEISFDAVGYSIPCPTLSRIGEFFYGYHSSSDTLGGFLRPDSQRRHWEVVSVMARALTYLEENAVIVPKFRGNLCLSNPKLNLYMDPCSISNNDISGGAMKTYGGKAIDLRNFVEFYLDSINGKGASILDIASAANIPFDFVKRYSMRFADKNLTSLKPVNRNYKISHVSSVSLDPFIVHVNGKTTRKNKIHRVKNHK